MNSIYGKAPEIATPSPANGNAKQLKDLHNILKQEFREAIVLDEEISGLPLRVGLRLMFYYDMAGNGRCFPSIDTIAQDLSVTVRGVQKAIERLERAGWFAVERTEGGKHPGGGGHRSNEYFPIWGRIEIQSSERWDWLLTRYGLGLQKWSQGRRRNPDTTNGRSGYDWAE